MKINQECAKKSLSLIKELLKTASNIQPNLIYDNEVMLSEFSKSDILDAINFLYQNSVIECEIEKFINYDDEKSGKYQLDAISITSIYTCR